jgi:nucleoside-triphosphatase THEP1
MRQRGAIYVLTGERGSGKTLICTQIVADARARGLDVAGLLTGRSGPEPGDPRQVVDLRSGESRPFGTQEHSGSHGGGSGTEAQKDPVQEAPGSAGAVSPVSDPLTPGWGYAADVFEWADEVLSRATPCDLLVVDEVGPLELLGARGWVRALELLREHDFRMALVVCRPDLLDELEASLGAPPEGVFRADPENADELAATMLGEMLS